MRVTFVGAARTVTGSCTLLETSGKKILIDCGLPQGNDEKVLGLQLPFDPASIDYVFLTHAHIDHSGRIPLLVRKGFKGQIYATDATVDLCSIMLSDSAHIQEMENEWLNRKKLRAGEKLVEPLYEVKDAQRAMELFVGFSYDQRIKVTDNIDIEFTDAGHLLGSAYVQIWATEGTERRHLVFSGDIGNLDQPLINDPAMIKEADFVVVESTYGDRNHKQSKYASQKEATEGRSKQLAEIIKETFDKGGNVIIPSFAVGRTQELLYLLRNIINHNLLPEIPYLPVFLDSPLAIEATKIFSKNIHGYFDDEAMKLVEEGHNPLIFDSLTATVSADESKELNFRKESCVIISSSGMCEAGRIKHHLKHNLWRKESSIVFSGYQSSGTLGRSIVDWAKQVTIFSEKIDVKASIKVLEGISGHADQQGLIRWLEGFTTKKPRHIFVNHGSWSADPQIGISHTFKFGDSGDALDDLSLSKQRIEIELNYQKQILNFESSIYGKIIELLNLEKTLLNNEKDIYVAKTKVEDSKILKDISFESASFKSLELDLARKESAKNSTLQKIALVQSQYEQLTGHLWQGVEDITKASLKLPSLKGGDSSVILASIDLEYAKEQLEVQKRATVRTQAGLTVPTLTVQGSAGLNYASSSDKVSYSVGTSASYSGKDFGTSASVGLSINDERVVPTVTIGGSWSKNTTGTSDYLTLQNLENRVTLANIDYQQALIDYQMKLNSLASEVLDYEVSLNQFEQIVEITKQNLETTKEAFELGLVTETDLNNALLEVELLKFDKDVLELNGLILENKIKELSL